MDSGNAKNVGPFMGQFKNFEVVAEANDHHYFQHNKNQQNFFNESNASLYASIMKEWKILKENLPEAIYVQVYETRIDLLRAVIIGPAGTPYQDGLFFFDIVLPADYPRSPPQVYYRSHGHRLNPNLYDTGYLCLSLVNTWDGSKDERWSDKSTLLRLLVSIQGLVLNESPFFNEPGYHHAQKSESPWMNHSIDYNEEAFLLSCKTMIQIIKQPPVNFENFVALHFRERAASILAAVELYQKGQVLVGQFDHMNGPSSSLEALRVSPKFKANLVEIKTMLNNAFASIQISEEANKDKRSVPCTSTAAEEEAMKKMRHDQRDQSTIVIK